MKFLATMSLILFFNVVTAQAEVKPEFSVLDYACGEVTSLMPNPVYVTEVCLSIVTGTKAEMVVIKYSDSSEDMFPIVLKESLPTLNHDQKTLTNLIAYTQGSAEGILNTAMFLFKSDLSSTATNAGLLSGLDRNGVGFQAEMIWQSITK